MAFVNSGPMVGFSGTINGVTYYQIPDGRTVAKPKNKKRSVPATQNQTVITNDTRRCAEFMRPLKEFTRVGYDLEAKKKPGQNGYNCMVKELRTTALAGTGEERYIDFSRVLMTKGNMYQVAETTVERTEFGIDFNWNPELTDSTTHWSDQVMMIAYFPELGDARYISAGPQRHEGKATLQLKGVKKGYTAEIYISFVADDRSSISNSQYLGQLNW